MAVSQAKAYPTVIISKAKAALESAMRTFVQTFVGAIAVLNFSTVTLGGAKIAVISAASAALAAAVAAAARVFLPLSTDKAGTSVA